MARPSQSQRIYDCLKEMITKRELLPGQQIIETDIAARYAASRTPVRKAIRMLAEEGLVEVVPNRGCFLKELTKADIVMVCEVAEALEGMACYLLAEKQKEGSLPQSYLERLEGYVKEMERAVEDNRIKAWVLADDRFHAEIAEMAGNRFIIQERNHVFQQLNQLLWFITSVEVDKRKSNLEHRGMLEAIQEGDAERARMVAQKQRHRIRDGVKILLD